MRKFKYIFICIATSLFVFGCSKSEEQTISINRPIESEDIKLEEDTKVKEDDDENIDKKTIVIDPGHSSVGNREKEPISPGSDKTKTKDVLGATGYYTKVPEHKTNLSISLLLRKELESRGYNVVMTKTKLEESISNIQRATIGNESNADLVIRIHADSSENHNIQGASTLVPSNNSYTEKIAKLSEVYGTKIIETYTSKLNIKNRGVIKRSDMTGFNWSKVPVIILEMGFISNESDDRFISNTDNHDKISKAIADSIDSCFK